MLWLKSTEPVHRYAQARGGELEIESAAERGTVVRLHLPGAVP